MPNQPKTPAAAYRIPLELRDLLKARAEADGVTQTEVVKAALALYLGV
ncbi:hypothetical protein [Glaciihabitans sp. UYNi722]